MRQTLTDTKLHAMAIPSRETHLPKDAPCHIPTLMKHIQFLRQFCILFALLNAWGLGAAETTLDPVTYRIAGLRLVRPDVSAGLDAPQAFAQPVGTSVVLRLHTPTRVVGLDEDSCKILAWKDNLGTDLLKHPNVSSDTPAPKFRLDRTSPDGRVSLMQLDAPGFPSQVAQRLSLSATLSVILAEQEGVENISGLSLAVGTKFGVGDCQYAVLSKGPSEGDPAVTEVRLSIRGMPAMIKSLRFINPDTKEDLGFQQFRMQHGPEVTAEPQVLFLFPALPKQVNLNLTYWKNLRRIPISVSIENGLGG